MDFPLYRGLDIAGKPCEGYLIPIDREHSFIVPLDIASGEKYYTEKEWNKRMKKYAFTHKCNNSDLEIRDTVFKDRIIPEANIAFRDFIYENGIAVKFLQNYSEQAGGAFLSALDYYESDKIVLIAFDWKETPEGYGFWNDVHKRWIKRFRDGLEAGEWQYNEGDN